MAKLIPDTALDDCLDQLTGTTLYYCTAVPANYAGIAAVSVGSKAAGAWTKANNDGGTGRMATQPEQTGITATAAGSIVNIAIVDGSNVLRSVTDCTSTAVTNGATFSMASFAVRLPDLS